MFRPMLRPMFRPVRSVLTVCNQAHVSLMNTGAVWMSRTPNSKRMRHLRMLKRRVPLRSCSPSAVWTSRVTLRRTPRLISRTSSIRKSARLFANFPSCEHPSRMIQRLFIDVKRCEIGMINAKLARQCITRSAFTMSIQDTRNFVEIISGQSTNPTERRRRSKEASSKLRKSIWTSRISTASLEHLEIPIDFSVMAYRGC